MKKLINFKWTIGILAISLFSCDPDVSLENPNDLTPETFFETSDQIKAAANGAYAQLQSTGLYQRYGYILPDSFSDESQSGGDANFITSWSFQLTPVTPQVNAFWTTCYRGVAACNFLLNGKANMEERLANGGVDYTQEDINDALGQGHFLRGLYYYHLVKRFGGVPIIVDLENTLDVPRSTEEEVYNLIISDFKIATELLFEKGKTDEGRATRGAALGMLGKVYLHKEKYDSAKLSLDQITGYSLLPLEEYDDNFNESGEFNDESMFEVIYTDEQDGSQWDQNGQGLAEVTWHAQEYTGWTNLRPADKMINEFETDDPRLQSAILQEGDPVGTDGTTTWGNGNAWKKFSQLYENNEVKENGETNVRILRYADVVLMKAEVENKLSNDAGAIAYLNMIRDRVQLPQYGTAEMDTRGYPVGSSSEVFDAIVHERMIELCAEQQRYDDLVRWNLDAQEITVDNDGESRGYNPDIHRLMPIPQTEVDTNSNLNQEDQNPGY
ncbi:MAG: RagB/SusD family nutrient uptake outer membrane protein [Cyclobacteriaceae bacterium]